MCTKGDIKLMRWMERKGKERTGKERKETSVDTVLIISTTLLASACPDISQKHFAISMGSG
jgi:hypothetical protein